VQVAVGEDDEAAVLRAGVLARLLLADQWVLALGLRLENDKREALVSSRRKSTKPFPVFSKLSPSASRSADLIVTPGSSRMVAGWSPAGKKRQPAVSSSLLILMRAVASFSDTQAPRSAGMVVKRHNGPAAHRQVRNNRRLCHGCPVSRGAVRGTRSVARTMFRPIHIRTGSASPDPYNTPLLFANNTPYLPSFQ
jgi:hypothetical protein